MRETSSIELQSFYPESLQIIKLQIIKIEETTEQIKITMKSRKHSHHCPKCGNASEKYHSVYMRTVQDLPIYLKNVILRIKAYKYDCETLSFAEDYDGFIGRSDRMTERLENFIRTLALETNCEGAAAICKELGIRTSGDTIIRTLRKLCGEPAARCGETIGVDDFAYRKGMTYCTVICDGETHKPIEVLDGRDGTALKEWLRANKHVKKVTRDRAGTYAKAISEALPGAMQIADRFHLHHNLLTAVKDALSGAVPNEILIPNRVPEFKKHTMPEANPEETAAKDKKNRI